MIDLDDLATTYIDGLVIPAGPGVEAIRARGRQRRTRIVTAWAAAATVVACILGVGALAVLDGGSQSISAADDTPEVEPTGLVDMDDQLSVLDDWSLEELPSVWTPSVRGWTTETINMSAPNRFYNDGAQASYLLRRGSEELSVEILHGQVDLADPGRTSIVLDRPDGSRSAQVSERSDETTLLWNERPGANTGIAVIIHGATLDRVIGAASDLALEERRLVGSDAPDTQLLEVDRFILLEGVTSGATWQITRSDQALPILEVHGIAPTVTSSLEGLPTFGPDLAVTSISYDRRQINMLRIPNDAVAELVDPERNRIPLPTVAVAGTTYSIAVAPIPAGKQASVIIVRYADGTETNIGLPWIPTSGWSTASLAYTTPED